MDHTLMQMNYYEVYSARNPEWKVRNYLRNCHSPIQKYRTTATQPQMALVQTKQMVMNLKKKMHEKVLYIYISYLHCATYSGQRVIFSTNRRMVRPHSSAVTQQSVPESSHNSQSTSDDSNSNNIDGEPAFFFT